MKDKGNSVRVGFFFSRWIIYSNKEFKNKYECISPPPILIVIRTATVRALELFNNRTFTSKPNYQMIVK